MTCYNNGYFFFIYGTAGVHKSRATKFCTVEPNICGSSVWIFLDVSLLVPRILRYPLDKDAVCSIGYIALNVALINYQ
jgi:hypothetical protein